MTSSAKPLNAAATFIDSLNTAAVRMLANAVFGQPLLHMLSQQSGLERPLVAQALSFDDSAHKHPALFSLTDKHQQWLHQLDQEPRQLLEYLHNDKHIKLGIYHERLWQFFLLNNDDTQLLASNLTARNNGNDLGEFDLIYHHRDFGLVHLEIASKYYLACSQHTDNWETWLGPGRTDRLDLKLNHSINKQMNLADHPRATEQLLSYLDDHVDNHLDNHLNKLSIKKPTAEKPLSKQLHIGGRLFYRRENPLSPSHSAHPEHLSEQHQTGHWLLLSEWQDLLSQHQVDYHLIDKPYWLDTAKGNQRRLANTETNQAASTHTSTSTSTGTSTGTSTKMPEMIIYRIEALDIETAFCFIVPNDWLTRPSV
ncbi:MAG: DUF1853 family protein [Pseudomonadales bacterium]|nr:DUF1853 family protein [Pseudomonadales bacterium]